MIIAYWISDNPIFLDLLGIILFLNLIYIIFLIIRASITGETLYVPYISNSELWDGTYTPSTVRKPFAIAALLVIMPVVLLFGYFIIETIQRHLR